MTKIIYVDWRSQRIIANKKEKEEWINEWIDDYYPIYNFGEWLENYYEVNEVYNMTAEQKEELPKRYEEYVKYEKEETHRKAEKEFNKDFEAIGIEVTGYVE